MTNKEIATTKKPIHNPINPSVKQHLDRLGEYRLSCINEKGHKIWVRTNTQAGVVAIIQDWRSLGFKEIEVFEPPRYGVTQFWDVSELQETLKVKKA